MPMNEGNLKALADPFYLCIITAQSPEATEDQLKRTRSPSKSVSDGT